MAYILRIYRLNVRSLNGFYIKDHRLNGLSLNGLYIKDSLFFNYYLLFFEVYFKSWPWRELEFSSLLFIFLLVFWFLQNKVYPELRIGLRLTFSLFWVLGFNYY